MENRPDKNGAHRAEFDKAKKRIYATQRVCGICGQLVDFTKKYPDPMSPCIDHIIPIAKGGHPSSMDNLQLAHFWCNRQKSDKLYADGVPKMDFKQEPQKDFSRIPLSRNWMDFKPDE